MSLVVHELNNWLICIVVVKEDMHRNRFAVIYVHDYSKSSQIIKQFHSQIEIQSELLFTCYVRFQAMAMTSTLI